MLTFILLTLPILVCSLSQAQEEEKPPKTSCKDFDTDPKSGMIEKSELEALVGFWVAEEAKKEHKWDLATPEGREDFAKWQHEHLEEAIREARETTFRDFVPASVPYCDRIAFRNKPNSCMYFDKDNNDKIEANELKDAIRFFEIEKYKARQTVDTDKDFADYKSWKNKRKDGLGEAIIVSRTLIFENRVSISLSECDRKGFHIDPGANPDVPDFLVRRSFDDSIIALHKKDDEGKKAYKRSLKKAKGAIFSFTRDFNDNNSDVWEARGSIMYPFAADKLLKSLIVMPSLSFDRVVNDDGISEIDSLVSRLTFQWRSKGTTKPVDPEGIIVSGSLSYATDFDLESSVVAGEIDLELFSRHYLASGTTLGIHKEIPINYNLRAVLQTRFERVNATGDKANLVDSDSFFRWGPRLELTLLPAFYDGPLVALDRMSIKLIYSYLDGASGNRGHSDLFEASLTYRLDDKGNIGVEFNYRNGQTPLLDEDTDALTVGLSVKF